MKDTRKAKLINSTCTSECQESIQSINISGPKPKQLQQSFKCLLLTIKMLEGNGLNDTTESEGLCQPAYCYFLIL